MVILNLKLNHILGFDDFEVCFSYPRKLGKSLIEGENLSSIPSFRYKKLNIFVGSNATGKTSLLKCISSILDFLKTSEKGCIRSIVNPFFDSSDISVDFVSQSSKKDILHRMKIRTVNNKSQDFSIHVSHAFLELKQNDSYEKVMPTLNQIPDDYQDYLQVLSADERLSDQGHMLLPATEADFDCFYFQKPTSSSEAQEYLRILNAVLKTLDSSIREVNFSLDSDDAIVINHENDEKIIVQTGTRLTDIRRLSSGTKYGINLANIVYAIKYHLNGIYLIDEQFSYISSDIEVALLSTMVALLGDDEQIFFTTHNQNILSLGFPFHSFYFLRKDMEGERRSIRISCASEMENRNNVSPYNMYENDVFSSSADVSRIYAIVEEADKKDCGHE